MNSPAQHPTTHTGTLSEGTRSAQAILKRMPLAADPAALPTLRAVRSPAQVLQQAHTRRAEVLHRIDRAELHFLPMGLTDQDLAAAGVLARLKARGQDAVATQPPPADFAAEEREIWHLQRQARHLARPSVLALCAVYMAAVVALVAHSARDHGATERGTAAQTIAQVNQATTATGAGVVK